MVLTHLVGLHTQLDFHYPPQRSLVGIHLLCHLPQASSRNSLLHGIDDT